MTQRRTFTALLEPDGTQLKWVIARVPFEVQKVWPVRKRMRVRGEIEGFAFRTSLFPDPRGSGRVLLVNKKMQAAAKARAGDRVRIWLEPDLEERPAIIAPELARLLKRDRKLQRWFDALSDSMRREIGKWVDDAKTPVTRQKRAEKMAERLMQAMEGEDDPPFPSCARPSCASQRPVKAGSPSPRPSAAATCSESSTMKAAKHESVAPPKQSRMPCAQFKSAPGSESVLRKSDFRPDLVSFSLPIQQLFPCGKILLVQTHRSVV
jgi:hypothetical protein